MKTIAIIPARGGSKRIPRKNIKDFCGKPIIAYSIETALRSEIFDEVMVSTDDQEIADISMKYEAKIPFFRSPETSTDMAMTIPVLIEVLNEYKKLGQNFDHCCCIYPCAPFANSLRIKKGMDLLLSENADSVLPIEISGPRANVS
ncbi:MAG: acylneuraminate cytidylyltransferase family protein [Holosporaceae bacterium]|jgi:N-acylneuraminate cytidylyltransferase|nr:acylneuraminate cytidylyltransferase family protein [Holosporaceae bacterium]